MTEQPQYGAPSQPVVGQNQPTVHLDLDSQVRDDANQQREPFRTHVNGRVIEFLDPMELDYQAIMAGLQNPFLMLEYSLTKEDRRHLQTSNTPFWKTLKLAKDYAEYYHLEDIAGNFG